MPISVTEQDPNEKNDTDSTESDSGDKNNADANAIDSNYEGNPDTAEGNSDATGKEDGDTHSNPENKNSGNKNPGNKDSVDTNSENKNKIESEGKQDVPENNNYTFRWKGSYGTSICPCGIRDASLLHAGIQVTIRLNMGQHNMENLFQLEQELAERFRGIKELKLYSQPLFPAPGSGLTKHSDTQRIDIFQKQWELQKKIDADGFGIHVPLRRSFRMSCCMADKGNAVVIAPTGGVGLCEHYSESQFIGHVSYNRKDKKSIENWRKVHLDMEDCACCAYYPECIRLKKCAKSKECYPETRRMRIQQIKRSILYEYQRFALED